jgi:Carboxypeptidase regulatory-like domain
MKTLRCYNLLLVLCLLWLPSALFAQATGTISGTVVDASGASISEASVVATNTGTALKRSMVTNNQGQFLMSLLPTGTYELRAERPGFDPFVQQNIIVQGDSTVEVSAKLAVKGASMQVTVSDKPSMVEATATNLVQVIETKRVEDLPLNGRVVAQLMLLNSGVSNQGSSGKTQEANTFGGGAYNVPASINGSRGNGTNFLLDNAANNDNYTNIAAPFPNPDAVQEVSVQTSTFDAQFGHGVGGVVSAITRSGTNEFHGTAYDYLRNNDLNGSNYFSGRDLLKRNQFGATIGGPVRLGKLYDGRNRTFFFFSYQGTRTRIATPGSLAVAPSEAMKNGDLSAWLKPNGTGAIHDPLAPNTYFPGNIIPASRINPVAGNILKLLPTSNSPDYSLRFGTPTQQVNDNEFTMRGDHSFNDNQRISMRYFIIKYNQPWVTIPNNLTYVNSGEFGFSHNAAVNYTWVIKPSLLNQLTAGFNRETPQAAPPASLQGANFQALGANVLTMPNFPTMDISMSNWSGIGLGYGFYSPQDTYQLSDVMSYAKGRHNIRFGADVQRFRRDAASYFKSGGGISFTGQLVSDPNKLNAGDSFAELLLGIGEGWQQQSFSSWHLFNTYPALFVQDDIRVSRRLTINMGLRWEPLWDFHETSGKEATFIPGAQSTRFPNAPTGLLFDGDPGVGSSVVPPDLNNFAPRFGMAYQIAPKTVIRSAYGLFYDHPPAIMFNRSAQGQPFVQQTTITGMVSLSNPYGTAAPLNPAPVTSSTNATFAPYGTWALPSKDMRTGYIQNWNFVLEHQLGGDILLRAAYVASKGTKLLNAMEINPALYAPGATVSNENARRPYQPISGLQLGISNGNSSYQSLQLTAQKRFSHGVSVLANYTYSKSIDLSSYGSIEGNTGGPDPYNLNNNRGLSDFDVRNRLVISGVLQHPTLAGANRIVKTVVGGWQSNFIFTAQSGQPFTVASGVDNALTGVGGNFADYNGANPQIQGDRSEQAEITKWFNTSAFTTNSIGTIGSGRRNQLIGPGSWNMDYSLFKSFHIHERQEFQLRGEFFNLFNHTRLGNPNTTVTSTLFGQITSAYDPRIVQLALKFRF